MNSKRSIAPAVLAIATVLSCAPQLGQRVEAKPSGIFQNLSGSWHGSGRILLSGGNYQRVSCKAYYNVKNSGAGLGFAIRCASPGNKIELRARLTDHDGRLSGTWEERTFNAAGNVSGTADRGRVNLSIEGAVAGTINISYSGEQHDVSISTATEGLKGIAISLRR